jgi:hypothetical protein
VRTASTLFVAALALLTVPADATPQAPSDGVRAAAAPAFSGRFALALTAGPGCRELTGVGPLRVAVEVREASVSQGSEVSGQSASPSEVADQGRFVLLRQVDRLHGPHGASTLELGLRTVNGPYRVWAQLVLDGTAATAAGGRARASGTAFGEIEISLSSDPTGAPVGTCEFALDHQWSLEPI